MTRHSTRPASSRSEPRASSRAGARALRRNDEGAAAIELIGLLPFALLVAGGILQLALLQVAADRAESAARLAARSLSRDEDPAAVRALVQERVGDAFAPEVTLASGALPATGEPDAAGGSPDPDAVSARVTVTVPFLGFGVDGLDLEVSRHAVMPRTDENR